MLKIKKIATAFLGLVLLTSTMGVSVNRHYCLGMLVDESYFFPSSGCSNMEENTCSNEEITDYKKCCDDEQILIPGLDIREQLKDKIAIGNFLAISLPNWPVVSFSQYEPISLNLYPRPPSLRMCGREILIQVQRFLI